MIGCMQTRVRKQPIIALYFESENELHFYNLEALSINSHSQVSDPGSKGPLVEIKYLKCWCVIKG